MSGGGPFAGPMATLTAQTEELMRDECVVTRPAVQDPTPVLDADGNPVSRPGTKVYAGRCTIADPATAQQGGRTLTDQSGVPNTRVGKLPVTSPALRPGDVLEVTAAAASPGLLGDTFVVIGEEERSYATYRRYLLRGSSWLPV